MKISKKHKNQAKSSIKNSSLRSEIKKPKRVWAAKKGDLVSIEKDGHGIVLESDNRGYFLVLAASGTRWYQGKKVIKIQSPDTCKKDNGVV